MSFHHFESFPTSSRGHSERHAESSKHTDNAIRQSHGMGVGHSFSIHENEMHDPQALGCSSLTALHYRVSLRRTPRTSDPSTHGEETSMLRSPLKRGFQYICDNFIPSLGSLDADPWRSS
ncbi:hypothetical protein ACEPAH_9280 [Sanghuangporus vaninii]